MSYTAIRTIPSNLVNIGATYDRKKRETGSSHPFESDVQ